jgi:hypothetical protein
VSSYKMASLIDVTKDMNPRKRAIVYGLLLERLSDEIGAREWLNLVADSCALVNESKTMVDYAEFIPEGEA